MVPERFWHTAKPKSPMGRCNVVAGVRKPILPARSTARCKSIPCYNKREEAIELIPWLALPMRVGESVAVASLLLAFFPGTRAQTTCARQVESCQRELVPYRDWPKVKHPAWSLKLVTPQGGQLYYFGSYHSKDPQHSQNAKIEKIFKKFRPTIVFYEGTARSVAATREEAIRSGAEAGLVRFLAAQAKIPFITMDPARKDEVAFLLKRFRPIEVKLFEVLQIVSEWREHDHFDENEIKTRISSLLENMYKVPGMETVVRTPEELDTAYHEHWSEPPNWWQAPAKWFAPNADRVATGRMFTNEIAVMQSEFRDVNMYRVLAEAVRRGERVFAVVGRNHIPMQEPALRCALQ